MEKYEGTRYNSKWDGSTWFILGLVAVCCAVPYFLDDGIWPTIICLVMLAFVLVTFLSIYYRIDGDTLVVYSFLSLPPTPLIRLRRLSRLKVYSHHRQHRCLIVWQSPSPTERFSKAPFLSLYRPCVKRNLSGNFFLSIHKLSIWHR